MKLTFKRGDKRDTPEHKNAVGCCLKCVLNPGLSDNLQRLASLAHLFDIHGGASRARGASPRLNEQEGCPPTSLTIVHKILIQFFLLHKNDSK